MQDKLVYVKNLGLKRNISSLLSMRRALYSKLKEDLYFLDYKEDDFNLKLHNICESYRKKTYDIDCKVLALRNKIAKEDINGNTNKESC